MDFIIKFKDLSIIASISGSSFGEEFVGSSFFVFRVIGT